MKFKRILGFLLVVLAIGLVPAAAQSSTATPEASSGGQSLTIFAASSLTDAFNEIATNFKAANPGTDITFNYGGSSTLVAQLSQGAPADIFASANNTQMAAAQKAGRIGGTPVTFAKNRLVLIVPADNPAHIQTLHDVANSGVKLVVAAQGVPVRDYTETMLKALAADSTYGDAYVTAFRANIVSEEANVRDVSAKVALGEADAGFVYRTDVTPDIASKVMVIQIPDLYNTIATYPIAVTNDSANAALAQKFIDYIMSDDGQKVLTSWNFITYVIPPQPATVTLSATAGSATVDGQVLNPLTLTVDSLKSDFTSVTENVSFLSGTDTTTASFTGVPLWAIMSAAEPNFNADVKNDKLSTYLVVTGTDGYQAVIAWGEIDPDFTGEQIIVAYAENGQPITDTQGPIRLVVPSDKHGGRYVSGVADISLRDAPPAQK